MKLTQTASKPSRNQNAYTLIEVLVAMVSMGLVSASLFAGIGSGFALIQVTREDLRATQILLERMETIRLYRWEQITDENFIPKTFTSCFYPDSLATGGGGISYTGTVAITAVSSNLPPEYRDEMRQVKVQIGWMSGNKRRTREMISYTSRHGLQNYVYSPIAY